MQNTNGEPMENWFVRIGVIGVKMSNGENKVANIESGMSHVRKNESYIRVKKKSTNGRQTCSSFPY